MNKWTVWYDSLPAHTKRYLDQRPVWHDRDLAWIGVLAFAMGVVVGISV